MNKCFIEKTEDLEILEIFGNLGKIMIKMDVKN